MGGGRSGLFPGTKGADAYQHSLFPDVLTVRRRGAIYIPVMDNAVGGGVTVVGPHVESKLRVLTVKEVLEKFMDYRYGDISEANLVRWLQKVLTSRHYYIEPSLRRALTRGYAALKATKTAAQVYDKEGFLSAIEKIESEIS